jgi:hypothetical protein
LPTTASVESAGMSQRISHSDSRVLRLSIDSSFSTQPECYFAPLARLGV